MSDVRLSVAIMAMPTRAEMAERLAVETGGTIVWDRGRGQLDTAVRALRCLDREATHHLVLEDDALPIPGFLGHARDALAVTGSRPLVSFYLGRGVAPWSQPYVQAAVEEALHQDAAWIGNVPVAGVALAYPVADLPGVRHALKTCPKGVQYDDRVANWYRVRRRPVLATLPSLVQHADTPSTIWTDVVDPLPRVAWALGVPRKGWNTPVMHMASLEDALA